MKPISQNEARQIMLDILDDVSSFCDNHGLKYYLAFGTLIGAIRHQGFIPWDDDIDIEMPRPDLERFIRLYEKTGKYAICSHKDPNSFLFHTKIYHSGTVKIEEGVDYNKYTPLGVDIDIFPIDGQPDRSHEKRFRHEIDSIIFLHKLNALHYSSTANTLKAKFAKLLMRPLKKKFFVDVYTKLVRRYDFDSSEYVGYMSPFECERYKVRHNKKVYDNRKKMMFEGKEYWGPDAYDEYLTSIYGDYMQLPPIEKQKSHHKSNIFWKE